MFNLRTCLPRWREPQRQIMHFHYLFEHKFLQSNNGVYVAAVVGYLEQSSKHSFQECLCSYFEWHFIFDFPRGKSTDIEFYQMLVIFYEFLYLFDPDESV